MSTKRKGVADHHKIAERARKSSGKWVFVKKYPNVNSASVAASFIRTGRMAAYPKGEFEARQSGDERVNVSVRHRP